MKQVIFLFLILTSFTQAFAQADITVCHTSSTEKFAMFASNKDFNAAHPFPRKYVHTSQEGGKMITFETPDGTTASGYLLTAKRKTDNWIFVFQEWWGLNDNIKRESEQLFKDLGNVNVLALDMYDGQIATEPAEARKLMGHFKQERGDNIVKGALSYAGKHAKVGTVGWCFGGGQSLLATLTLGKHAAGGVIYYGMPVDDKEKLKTLHADILGIFAAKEKFITQEIVQKFEANMKEVGKNVTIKNYEAEHGFANPSNPHFDKVATEDAYKHTVAFFKERLK